MRWPTSRFVSALEQFNVPQRMRVPCKRERRNSGGACHGSTCDHAFPPSRHPATLALALTSCPDPGPGSDPGPDPDH
eukprot:scaffold30302_cov48-Phaeocystis_antarctica.AAC.3